VEHNLLGLYYSFIHNKLQCEAVEHNLLGLYYSSSYVTGQAREGKERVFRSALDMNDKALTNYD